MSVLPSEPDLNDVNARQMQASGLSRLLHLSQQMRRSQNLEELQFLVMNETRQLIIYDESLLFFDYKGKDPVLQCISGLATFERETPKVAWLEKHIAAICPRDVASLDPVFIKTAEISEDLREGWQEFMSAEAVLIPFRAGKLHQDGFFLYTRIHPWTEKEAKLLSEVAENFAYVYSAHQLRPGTTLMQKIRRRKTRVLAGGVLAVLLVLFWPVRETLIADMEVTPVSPWVATAPIEGVIRKILVEPNVPVKIGTPLFEMDDTTLRNEVILANERLEIARQELWQARQQVVNRNAASGDKRPDAALLALEVKKKENEARYNTELLQKAKVAAGADGVTVFSSPSEIEGRPARTGEAIMMIANPDQVELTVNMPVADSIVIKPGDSIRAYLNAMPFSPLKAHVRYVSYKAQKTEVPGQFAYRIKADLDPGQNNPRLGLKGTARVKGERTTLFYVLFRKPLGYARRMVGI